MAAASSNPSVTVARRELDTLLQQDKGKKAVKDWTRWGKMAVTLAEFIQKATGQDSADEDLERFDRIRELLDKHGDVSFASCAGEWAATHTLNPRFLAQIEKLKAGLPVSASDLFAAAGTLDANGDGKVDSKAANGTCRSRSRTSPVVKLEAPSVKKPKKTRKGDTKKIDQDGFVMDSRLTIGGAIREIPGCYRCNMFATPFACFHVPGAPKCAKCTRNSKQCSPLEEADLATVSNINKKRVGTLLQSDCADKKQHVDYDLECSPDPTVLPDVVMPLSRLEQLKQKAISLNVHMWRARYAMGLFQKDEVRLQKNIIELEAIQEQYWRNHPGEKYSSDVFVRPIAPLVPNSHHNLESCSSSLQIV